MTEVAPVGAGHLKGWKQIGAFLNTSARTAQRWERTLGLPVHRIGLTSSTAVFADPSELLEWAKSAAGRRATSAAGEEEPAAVELQPPTAVVVEPAARRWLRVTSLGIVLLAAIALIAVVAVGSGAWRHRSTAAGTAPRPSSSPRDTYLFKLTMSNGHWGIIGLAPGIVGTVSVGSSPFVVVSMAPEGDDVVLRFYQSSGRPEEPKPPLTALATLSLKLGEEKPVSAAIGIDRVQWQKVLRARSDSVPPRAP
jgi:hypothetical protein